ncbi:hypothetical protein VR5_059 [Escherichia phage vb_EcoM-VR5]|uniref:Uncharacterized protein n=1 Tax=Escherichia phage vb_EcoM-VR5 TaxID=1567026 RepID=A0A0A7HC41_9CAUD|nr:hypothetical protein AVV69_gp059 [Escherichia phage vb_EcoM-VR5]AIZ01846.1 hypothetical protein VR5_059 [Escherichia phage vb_EcoM-VR5]
MTSSTDFDKIKSDKNEMMLQFEAARIKAENEGTITYKPIKFTSNREPLYGVLIGKEA